MEMRADTLAALAARVLESVVIARVFSDGARGARGSHERNRIGKERYTTRTHTHTNTTCALIALSLPSLLFEQLPVSAPFVCVEKRAARRLSARAVGSVSPAVAPPHPRALPARGAASLARAVPAASCRRRPAPLACRVLLYSAALSSPASLGRRPLRPSTLVVFGFPPLHRHHGHRQEQEAGQEGEGGRQEEGRGPLHAQGVVRH